MIPPYSGATALHLGPLTVPIFGVLVSTGVVLGHALTIRLARERGIAEAEMRAAAAWALVAGFAFSHVFDVVFYYPDRISRDGILTLLKVWDGISSYGGFFGAVAGLALYFRSIGKSWWTHADMLVQGLTLGWVFGRLGCTLTSDHLGSLSNSALAFAYPAGARHNLGFLELAYTILVLVPAILIVRVHEHAKGYKPGIYLAVVIVLYASVRFFLDFLRATDIEHADLRYFGLTAGQYSSVAVLLFALMLVRRLAGSKATQPRPAGRE